MEGHCKRDCVGKKGIDLYLHLSIVVGDCRLSRPG